jgi:predicted dehydrogenase
MLRIGVVGCGRVFERFHLPALNRTPSLTIGAVCDPDPRRLEWISRHAPHPATYASLDDLLESPDSPQALLILTPPATHAELAVRALERGVHVLVEKPMALSVSEGCTMVDAARRGGAVLQVGFTRRFRAPYQRLRERLGNLQRSTIRSIGFELAFSTAGWNALTAFLGDDSRGGGVFDDVLSHQVDLICWLLGEVPDEVRARVSSGGTSVSTELRFGALVAECKASHGRYRDRLTVELADRGVLEATGNRFRHTGTAFPALRLRRAMLMDRVALVEDRLLRRPNVSLSSFEHQLRDFERAAHALPAMGASGEDGLLVLRTIEACRDSARQHGEWRPLG